MTAGPAQAAATPQEEDWRRFKSLSDLVNHWDRPGWTDTRQAYYWYLTFDSTELRELAERCQQELRMPYLDPVPLDRLHLTLPRVGWADEISEDDALNVAQAANVRCAAMRPFELRVGPLSGSAGAVRFSVSPWVGLVSLYRHLRGAVATVVRRQPEPEFRPHIGIAYCNEPVPAAPLIERVGALRTLPVVQVGIRHVDLVLIRRERRTYIWSNVKKLPLGNRTTAN
jgi:2'-5' RNA ligase